MRSVTQKAVAIVSPLVAFRACEPEPPPRGANSQFPASVTYVQLVAGNASTEWSFVAVGGATKWNQSGSDAPQIGQNASSYKITINTYYDPQSTALGVSAETTRSPWSQPSFALNTYNATPQTPWSSWTAAHEIGHTLGLAHSPFHDGDASYVATNSDCGNIGLMYWTGDAYTVCGVNYPTSATITAINKLYD